MSGFLIRGTNARNVIKRQARDDQAFVRRKLSPATTMIAAALRGAGYWISWSARSNIDLGIVSPIALTVLM